jgi:hypothetical protein
MFIVRVKEVILAVRLSLEMSGRADDALPSATAPNNVSVQNNDAMFGRGDTYHINRATEKSVAY